MGEKLVSRIKRWASRTWAKVRMPFAAAWPLLPQLFADRHLVLTWLGRAHAAQAALVVGLLFGLLAMPWLRDLVVDLILPPTVESVFLGLGREEIPHPWGGVGRVIFTIGYWLAANGLVLWFLARRGTAGAGRWRLSGEIGRERGSRRVRRHCRDIGHRTGGSPRRTATNGRLWRWSGAVRPIARAGPRDGANDRRRWPSSRPRPCRRPLPTR